MSPRTSPNCVREKLEQEPSVVAKLQAANALKHIGASDPATIAAMVKAQTIDDEYISRAAKYHELLFNGRYQPDASISVERAGRGGLQAAQDNRPINSRGRAAKQPISLMRHRARSSRIIMTNRTPHPRALLTSFTALAMAIIPAVSVHAQGKYRDLNHNGQLDPYENTRLPIDARSKICSSR